MNFNKHEVIEAGVDLCIDENVFKNVVGGRKKVTFSDDFQKCFNNYTREGVTRKSLSRCISDYCTDLDENLKGLVYMLVMTHMKLDGFRIDFTKEEVQLLRNGAIVLNNRRELR